MNEIVAAIGKGQVARIRLHEANAGIDLLEKRSIFKAGRRDAGLVLVPGLKIVRVIVQTVVGHADVEDVVLARRRQRTKKSIEHLPALTLGDPDRQRAGLGVAPFAAVGNQLCVAGHDQSDPPQPKPLKRPAPRANIDAVGGSLCDLAVDVSVLWSARIRYHLGCAISAPQRLPFLTSS